MSHRDSSSVTSIFIYVLVPSTDYTLIPTSPPTSGPTPHLDIPPTVTDRGVGQKRLDHDRIPAPPFSAEGHPSPSGDVNPRLVGGVILVPPFQTRTRSSVRPSSLRPYPPHTGSTRRRPFGGRVYTRVSLRRRTWRGRRPGAAYGVDSGIK